MNDVFSGIAVAQGQDGVGYTFGELAGTSVSGSVFIDANNDGIFDRGEAGLSGVTVTLTGTDDLGNAVDFATTSALDGSYSFNYCFCPSDAAGYTLTEVQPANLLDGKKRSALSEERSGMM